MNQNKQREADLDWAVFVNRMCSFSKATFFNLKNVNPKAYEWIIRKTIWNNKRSLPIDFPTEIRRIEKELILIDDEIKKKDSVAKEYLDWQIRRDSYSVRKVKKSKEN